MWNLTGSPFDLQGRVAIVTGGGRGLGAVMAQGLSRAGAAVALVDLADCKHAVQTIQAEGGRAEWFSADVTDAETLARMVAQVLESLGPVDILVNNAGISPFRVSLDSTRAAGWQKVLNTNLTGPLLCIQAIAPIMKERRSGKVINITSASGRMPTAGLGAYCVSKAGLIHFTRQLAMEWGPYNIQVNAIGPGYMDVGLARHVSGLPEFDEFVRTRVSMERSGRAEELIGALIMLASDASSYITGQTLFIDGGMLG